MPSMIGVSILCLALAPLPLQAAPKATKPSARPIVQQVIPPKTVYWMSAATQSGFGVGGKAPSAGDMMKMAMGGGSAGPMKLLNLDLGSKLPPAGPPTAQHFIPPAMTMGTALALKTPKKIVGTTAEPGDFERPKGRLLLFWGCGDTARPGQPVVFDFAKMAAGQVPAGLFGGEQVRIARGPSQSSWPTYGYWPNDDRGSRQSVPGDASLVGAHRVAGNYTPEIAFNLATDWMQGLDLRQAKLPSGALDLSWNGIPGTTAHFAQMMGAGGTGNEADGATIVFWSSSDSSTFVSGLSDYIAPAEAARLVGRKQLLPPAQTNCTIPKEAMAAAPTGLLTLVAHGPEENFVHPPRPADPKVPWVQDWTVKARYVSRTGGIAGMDMSAMGGSSSRRGKKGKPACQPNASDAMAEGLGGAVGGALGSMFGKKKKQPDCE
ncbi:MAG: hypothetical protein DCF31_02290 [Alphaproteobacteria bacterium]|nr:MAG: hypothetical protein DCF31_02290 [Alphaproteobacteria bacterium]